MIPARHLVTGLAAFALLAAGCGVSPISGNATQRGAARVAAKAAPANYYKSAEGLKGQDLLAALNDVVAKHKDLGYDGARDVMFQTLDDLDNDNRVTCIYIGRTLANVTNRNSAYQNGAGLNAEHTWPQSKGAVGAAKSDLNHLFASDCKANSTRGSFPFGEVKSPDWSEGGSVRGTDDKGRVVFQPRPEQRGDTARALLYFYTVYGRSGSTSLENFRSEEPILKKWHAADPVTAENVARNDAVMAAQGNRNPYIDRPEFVEAIGTFNQRR